MLNTVICGNLEVFKFPVTQEEYKKVVGVNPSYHNKERMGISTERFPVTNVSAYAAETFCGVLGGGWRLPTDEEWSLLEDAELGIYDMSGNVWEWTSTTIGSDRVVRGGSWYDGADYVRAAFRGGNTPAGSYDNLGFRPVRTIILSK